MKTKTLLTCEVISGLGSPALMARFSGQLRAGQSTGNQALVVSAGFRLAVFGWNAAEIRDYLLAEMGIAASVSCTANPKRVAMAFGDHYAFTKVMRALKGEFVCVAAMTKSGKQAVIACLEETPSKIP